MHGAGRVKTILLKDLLKGSISLPTILFTDYGIHIVHLENKLFAYIILP